MEKKEIIRGEEKNVNNVGICLYCGQVFKSNRSTAKYCSDYHRKRKDLKNTLAKKLKKKEEEIRLIIEKYK